MLKGNYSENIGWIAEKQYEEPENSSVDADKEQWKT